MNITWCTAAGCATLIYDSCSLSHLVSVLMLLIVTGMALGTILSIKLVKRFDNRVVHAVYDPSEMYVTPVVVT